MMENIFYWLVSYDARDSTSYHCKNAQVGDEGVQSIWLDFFKPVVKVSEISSRFYSQILTSIDFYVLDFRMDKT
jgi:hypothetical protein